MPRHCAPSLRGVTVPAAAASASCPPPPRATRTVRAHRRHACCVMQHIHRSGAAVQVHAHQAFSVLGNEAALHGRTLGLPVVFTDHSLFGFADAASICTNKILKWTLCDVQAVVCVSHTSKENTVLRAALPPARVFVVPNAIDMMRFRPFPRPPPPPDTVTCALRLPAARPAAPSAARPDALRHGAARLASAAIQRRTVAP